MNWKLKLSPNGAPLYQQIESAIRKAIESGQLKSGDRIPSAVELAKKHGINKLTVVKAFQRSVPPPGLTPDGAVGQAAALSALPCSLEERHGPVLRSAHLPDHRHGAE